MNFFPLHVCNCQYVCSITVFHKTVPFFLAVPSSFRKMEYLWTTDEVQTARILFYLRVIPTCVECIPASVFRKVLAPTMFLYPESDG